MKRIAVILGFLLFINAGRAQDIKGLARLFCDSLEFTAHTNPDSLISEQIKIQESIFKDILIKIIENNKNDYKNQFNILSYKLLRELNKNCPYTLIHHSTLLPFTKVIDFDSVFSLSQKDSLESIITEIRSLKNIQILVVEIDDFYPYDNIEDLSFSMIEDWNIGLGSSKGGILIIFSKALRNIRIATSDVAQSYLSDSDCQSIIDKTIIPDFKAGLYFQGIHNSLLEIKRKI